VRKIILCGVALAAALACGCRKAQETLSCSSPDALNLLQGLIDENVVNPANAGPKNYRPLNVASEYVSVWENRLRRDRIVDFAGCLVPHIQQPAHLAALEKAMNDQIDKETQACKAQLQAEADRRIEADTKQLAEVRDKAAKADEAAAEAAAEAAKAYVTLSATFENVITIGQTELRSTCKATIVLHKGGKNQPLATPLDYIVEKTDDRKTIVTAYGLTPTYERCEVLPGNGC
jgi:transcription elongation GreA/GreB family factor